MAKILTDRTSVRVTAKSDTDANNQKKNDANNIAKALGKNGDLDDAKASSVASKLGNTITDENGTTWAKSSEVAAAAKELDGEFEEKTTYKYGNVAAIGIYNFPKCGQWGSTNQFWIKGPCWIDSVYGDMGWSHNATMPEDAQAAIVKKVNEDKWYLLMTSPSGSYINFQASANDGNAGGAYYNKTQINRNNSIISEGLIPITEVGEVLSLSQYGDFHEETSGGSKIDTSKSEDQIKKELEDAAAANNAVTHFSSDPTDTYIAVTDANGSPMYFLGT